MKGIRKVRKTKRVQLLGMLFLVFIVATNAMLVGVQAHKNCPKGKTNEEHRGLYTFVNYDTYWCSYGPHDWIADSAIRLILLNPTYKNYVNWLFPSDTTDIKKCFFNLKTLPTQKISGGDGLDYFSYFNYDHLSSSQPCDRLAWKKLRTYVAFLHGTKRPDPNTYGKREPQKYFEISETFAPLEEKTSKAYRFQWMATDQDKNHHTFFEFEDGNGALKIIDYGKKKSNDASEWARITSELAIDYLKEPVPVVENGNEEEKDGKTEVAALCLGGMAHYIGEMSHPGHCVDNWGDHTNWDNYIAGECTFDENQNGKPEWSASSCDPSALALELTDQMKPKECVRNMAQDTFAGYDIDDPAYDKMETNDWTGRDLACGNTDNPFPRRSMDANDTQKKRMRTLIERAAFYTACAMLYTIKKAGWHDKTDDKLNYPSGTAASVVAVSDVVDERASSENLNENSEEEGATSQQNEIEEHHFNSQLWLVLSITGIATVVIPWLIQERIRSRAGSEVPAAS